MYELKEVPAVNEQAVGASMNNYVTRDEFDQVVAQLKAMLVPEQSKPIVEQLKSKVELNF